MKKNLYRIAGCWAFLLLVILGARHYSIQPTQRVDAQAVGPAGLQRVAVTGGILSGSGTVANPLTATITKDSTITGTGSAGSGLSASAAITTAQGLFFGGLYGSGVDGTCTFNGGGGSVCGATLAGSTYTMTREIFATNITVSTGIDVKEQGFRIYASGTLTLSGTGKIHRNGNNGSGTTGGAVCSVANVIGTTNSTGGNAGAPGATGTALTQAPAGLWTTNTTSNAGAIAGAASAGQVAGKGGGGGGGNATAGGTGGGITVQNVNVGGPSFWALIRGRSDIGTVSWSSGSGGGGGGNAATGGGGGSGGCQVVVLARVIAGSGTIEANGGNGANGGANGGGGGGGGGGLVVVVYSTRTGTVTATAAGGTKGTGGTGGGNGGDGLAGSTILLNMSGDGT